MRGALAPCKHPWANDGAGGVNRNQCPGAGARRLPNGANDGRRQAQLLPDECDFALV